MSISNILNLSYWFSIYTPPLRKTSFIAVVLMLAAFFIGAIALRIVSKKNKKNPPFSKGLRKISKPLFFFSILGGIFIWFRQIGAGILSARAWVFLFFLIAVAWLAQITRIFIKTHKREYEKFKAEEKYKEYLPKKKK